MLIIVGMESVFWVQILDKIDCVSLRADTFKKGINLYLLPNQI